ncbi:hypothetical protein AMTRI_Chr01g136730 [Amborella trichopoda]
MDHMSFVEPSSIFDLLNKCTNLRQFKQIHGYVITTKQCNLNHILVKKLVSFSLMGYARQVFDEIPQPDTTTFNSMLSGFSRAKMHLETTEIYFLMREKQTQFDSFSLPPVLKAFAALPALNQGRSLHSFVIKAGFSNFSLFTQTGLVDLYAKCGDLGSAQKVFDAIPERDIVSYNTLISGYSKAGMIERAQHLFNEMRARNIVTWNAMLSGYLHSEKYSEGLKMFEDMSAMKMSPNEATLVTVLALCSRCRNIETGKQIGSWVRADPKFRDNLVLSTALLEMYVKCGRVEEARAVFDKTSGRDLVIWGAMIAGYAQNSRPFEALDLFEAMQKAGFSPNEVTLVSALSACAQLGSIERGERIVNYVNTLGGASSPYLGSALIDMYSKCGQIDKAIEVFDGLDERDSVAYNAMINGLASHGLANQALELFSNMRNLGILSNDVTFVGVLVACAHAGLVDKGQQLFYDMELRHGIEPKIEHCACFVDLLCRGGRVEEAYDFVERKMKVEANVIIWGSLLSGCRVRNNVELAERCVERLTVLEPDNSGNYVMLSNVYAKAGRWEEALKVREKMREKGVKKRPAYSWITIDNKVHMFLVGDESHPEFEEIYEALHGLCLQIRFDGDISDLGFGNSVT